MKMPRESGMTGNRSESAAPGLPGDFSEQVRQALAHLYDFAYLRDHPLAQRTGADPGQPEARGQSLRQELMIAIEALDPGEGIPFSAPPARLHSLLQLHYIESLTVQESAHELGVSLRQAHRDLRRAEESVAALLWERLAAPLRQPRAIHLSSLQREVERLERRSLSVDLGVLLQRTQRATERLARDHGVALQVELPPEPLTILSDPVVAQQVLTSVLSHAVQQARPEGGVTVTVRRAQSTTVTLHYAARPGLSAVADMAPLAAQLAERLGWRLSQGESGDDNGTVVLEIGAHGPAILVIDDNEGLMELLRRCLADHACRVMGATDGEEGLRLAQELQPDAIVLDVMMPGIDGWEVLQILRNRRDTAGVPIVICSVFNDPKLALSLGASAFLAKPVSRENVLEALDRLGVF